VKDQIDQLDVRSQGNLSRLIRTWQEGAGQLPASDRTSLHEQVALFWASSGDSAAALTAADQIDDPVRKATARVNVVSALAKAGFTANALETANRLQDPKCIILAQECIAIAQGKAGDIIGAQSTFASAQKTVSLIQDAADRSETQKDIVGEVSEQESYHWKDIPEFLDLTAFSEWGPLAQIAVAQAKAGDSATTQRSFASALHSAAQIHSPQFKDIAWHGIAIAQARAGDMAGADNTVALIKAYLWKEATTHDLYHIQHDGPDSLEPNGFSEWSVLASVAVSQANFGSIASAQRSFLSALNSVGQIGREPHYKLMIYGSIAILQAIVGDLAGAGKTADLMKNVAASLKEYRIEVFGPILNLEDMEANALAFRQFSVSHWLYKLYDDDQSNDCALNTGLFLDLADYQKAKLLSDDAQEKVSTLATEAESLIKAQNAIDRMLKQQFGK
jgi:hypothetical protein